MLIKTHSTCGPAGKQCLGSENIWHPRMLGEARIRDIEEEVECGILSVQIWAGLGHNNNLWAEGNKELYRPP